MKDKLLKMLGIPVPTPLNRTNKPWGGQELAGKKALFEAGKGNRLSIYLKEILTEAGIGIATNEGEKVNFLVFDATGFEETEDLDALYQFFHAQIGRLAPCGRILLLADQVAEMSDVARRTSVQAIEGFTRALAKEIGRKGSTANLVMVGQSISDKEKEWLLAPVSYLLSDRSAFVSGQVFGLDYVTGLATKISLNNSLENKIALVTGSSRGIGKAIAEKLAKEGATVIINDREQEAAAAKAVAQAIGGDVLLGDISQVDAGERIAKFCQEKYGGLDLLIHNAGVTRDKTLRNMDESKWQQVLNINLRAVLKITETLRSCTLRNGGRVICLSSVSGIAGNVGQTNYSTSKAGLIGFAAAMGNELIERGITVNAIAPGFIETKMTAEIPFFTREAGRKLSNLAQGGLPEDVADLATFLCMPGAQGVTGQTLRVCGGALIGK